MSYQDQLSLQEAVSRRGLLKTAGTGFGYLALAGMLGLDQRRARGAHRRSLVLSFSSMVHVIGGGVGMAPLILLVEALRYYSFPVKVFLGMASLQSLRYRDELAATFGEKPRDAYIYVDDLLAAGVKPASRTKKVSSRA